jgi:hypothetical protein
MIISRFLIGRLLSDFSQFFGAESRHPRLTARSHSFSSKLWDIVELALEASGIGVRACVSEFAFF